jgi:Flp pilus assembly protein TadD
MDDHRDIYKKPEGPGGDDRLRGAYTIPAARIRGRVARQIVVLTILVAALLAIVASYLILRGQDEERKQLGEMLAEKPPATGSVDSAESPVTPLPSPGATLLPERVDTEPGKALGIAPQKMAEAMGEVRIANQYLQAREWDAAEEHARKALEIWPDVNAALRLLGVVYTQRGQFDPAIHVLEKALQSNPFSGETFNALAVAYMQKGMLDKAEDMLFTALQINPEDPLARVNLGLLYVLWERFPEAVENFEIALPLMSQSRGVRNNLSVALIRMGRYDEARKQLDILREQDPAAAGTFFNLALTYVLEGNAEEGLTWIREGVKRCSPAEAQRYLSDRSFDSVRGRPEFQEILRGLFPVLPQVPAT